MGSWRFKKEVLKQLGWGCESIEATRRPMSPSAALFKVQKFKLVVSQQVLEIKGTWQEAGR